ncbi:MAG: phosphate ABC transporter permease PstA [Chthoniobacterales bacterium]
MHAPRKNSKDLLKVHAAPGEPFVWLTAMGLAVGVLMVIGLLAVIVLNGLPVFWPHAAVAVQLEPGVNNPIANAPAVVGEIVERRTKAVKVLGPDGEPLENQQEIQFYVANRDSYGFSFVFLDSGDIAAIERPADLLAIERVEYGDAIGTPVAVVTGDGQRVEAGTPGFDAELQRLIQEGNRRRKKIERIEKIEIGRINSRLTELRVTGGESDETRQEIAGLTGRYDVLAAEARALREQQSEDSLLLRLPNQAEKTIAIGNIMFAYYPNQLGFFQKVGIFLHNIWGFLTLDPREANTEGGVFPAIFGTFVMTLLMSVAVMPFGVIAAIYLREYAKQGFFVRAVRIAVNNLAGVPSIVFGVFGLGFFVYFVGGSIDQLFYGDYLPTPTFGTGGIFWAALTLALMTVPVVIVATEESIASVPRGIKEGALACGASKWQTIQRIILPASLPGILTGLILAMARGAGEVAPLMLVGVVKLAPSLPLDGEAPFLHLERKFMHLGFHIYDLGFQSPDSEAAKPMVFATTLLLIVLVVLLNLTAILLRERLRKRFSTGAF